MCGPLRGASLFPQKPGGGAVGFGSICKGFLKLKPNASGLGCLGIILRALLKLHDWRERDSGIPFLGRRFW